MILIVASSILLAIGLPVAIALGAAALAEIWFGDTTIAAALLSQRLVQGVASFPLLAVPFFILAAEVMNASNITSRLLNLAKALFGHLPGGWAQVNIAASMIFSGVTGSAVAEAASLGKVEIRAMRHAGYSPSFAAAVTAASATIGPIIPPSIPFVIYGSIADVSVGRLLLAGAIPGVLMGLFMMAAVGVLSFTRAFPRTERASLRDVMVAIREAVLPLLTPVILVGGIVAGIFTPTEAAIVASTYAVVLAWFVYGEINARDLYRIFSRVAVQTAVLLFIVAFASLLGLVFTRIGLPRMLSELVATSALTPIGFLVAVNILLLIVGCFLESLAALTILAPLLAPVAASLGIDPVQFGVIFVLNLMIGLVTPPFGMNLFITKAIANVTMSALLKDMLPFYVALFGALAAVTFVPWVSTWLPGYVFQ